MNSEMTLAPLEFSGLSVPIYVLDQHLANFSCRGSESTLGFVGDRVHSQLLRATCSTNAATDSEQMKERGELCANNSVRGVSKQFVEYLNKEKIYYSKRPLP